LRLKTPWSKPRNGRKGCHAWTDGSFRKAAGLGWLITKDNKREGPIIAEGARNLGGQQTAFDAEVAAIEQAVQWFLTADQDLRHLIIHPLRLYECDRSSQPHQRGPGPEHNPKYQKRGV
jgi:hypothetical protein